jgi:hypothetical protein
MSVRLCAVCKKPCAGHIGPYGAACKDLPVKDETEGEEPKTEFVTREDFDKLSGQLTLLVAAVRDIKRDTTKPVSQIITPGKKQVVKGDLNLPPPSWPTRGASGGSPVHLEKPGGVEDSSATGDSSSEGKETTQSLARNKELALLLKEYNGGGTSDLLTIQESATSHTSRAQPGEKSVKKVHLIPDYINFWDGLADEEDNSFVTTKGQTFKLQSRQRRLSPREVSIPQWITANLNILDVLRESLSGREIREYLDYTKQVGDLLQIYTAASVFCWAELV